MKRYLSIAILLVFSCVLTTNSYGQSDLLTVVIIRHGEKPKVGNNLSCKGFNRSLQIPKSLDSQFRVASFVYVPRIKVGSNTSSVRMFQTITPYAVKHSLAVNSFYKETDHVNVATDVKTRKGIVLMVWEHTNIQGLAQALGASNAPAWNGKDFDSIWVITYNNKVATLDTTTHKEAIMPSSQCSL